MESFPATASGGDFTSESSAGSCSSSRSCSGDSSCDPTALARHRKLRRCGRGPVTPTTAASFFVSGSSPAGASVGS